MDKKIIGILVVTLLIGTVFFPAVNTLRIENEISTVNEDVYENISIDSNVDEISVEDTDSLEVTLQSGDYIIENKGDYSEIEMDGFGSLLNTGKPKLPYRTFLIGLRPGSQVTSVELIDKEKRELPGTYDIISVPSFIGGNGRVTNSSKYSFSKNEVYPDDVWSYVGMGQMRKYDFARISFCPMSYHVSEGKLVLYESITLRIEYKIVRDVSDELLADCIMDDLASEMLVNYHSIMPYYTPSFIPQTSTENRGYLIITGIGIDLQDSLNDFINWKEYYEYTIYVATIEDITSEYPGVDTPEKIRNYLKDTYAPLGLKYVLLVGSLSSIPARDCYPEPKNHSIKVVTEHYYADLTGDWDSDGDGYYGERGDDNWDVYPEVYVGRIPSDNPSVVEEILGKGIAFETDTDQEMKALLAGGVVEYANQLGPGRPKTDGAAVMESLCGFLTSNNVAITKMYEQEGVSPSIYSSDKPLTKTNMLEELGKGYRLVNWFSHGNESSLVRLVWNFDDGDGIPESNELEKIEFLSIDDNWDVYPETSIVFCGSCRANEPALANLGETILTDGPAAVSIGSRTAAFSPPGWDDENDGGIGSFQYYFNKYLVDEKQSCGEALFNTKTYCYDHFSDPYLEYHIYGIKIDGVLDTSLIAEEKEDEDEFEDQPANKHSNICCHPTAAAKDAEDIVDVNFAKALHDALGDEGFHSMVITFGQCFGGGIMDDVADKFSGSTKPISMTSGSKHNEGSYSTQKKVGGKNAGSNDWAQAYSEVHPGKTGNVNKNPKESDAYDKAKNTAVWKTPPQATAQQKTLNNGGDIKLGDGTGGSGATSYHAILFTGSTAGRDNKVRDDYWNDMARQHKMLTDSGYPAGNIKTFYGDGKVPSNTVEGANGIKPDPGTRENLVNAIKDLKGKMNENEQLYIFITDHGSKDKGTDTLPKPKPVTPKDKKENSNTFDFSPLSGPEIDALQSPYNTEGAYVKLNVKTAGTITSNWEVFFNNEPVNNGDSTFPGGGNEAFLRFPIDPDVIDLTGNNDVWLKNSQSTDDSIEVEIYFSMGDIETYDQQPPNTPTCRYDGNNDELVVSATDIDGDQVRYGVSWDNDYTVDQWTNLVNSGTEQRIDCGGRRGTVGVIAEDEYGAQSDWVSQKSKNKSINTPFLSFLENHPYLFPLLRQLLGLQ